MIFAYEKKINRKVRVFISSTFSDMQHERNIIVHSVFPRLRKEFSEKLIDITEVDLRWGIPEEDAENSRILEICIGEVLHCAPFFVGMVGSRYGSIASDEAIANLPPAYKKAIGESIPSGISITELEMRAGVFVPNNIDFSCFFIKKNCDQIQAPDPEVQKLIETITTSYETYEYDDGEAFEEALYQNLREYILKVIPERLENPYNDPTYFSHLRLVKNHNSRYVADNFFLTGIENRINELRKVYIQGKKGFGKSACISRLIYQEGVERSGDVFFHYATAGSQSSNTENAFFRLKNYLEAITGIESTETDTRNAVVDILSNYREDRRLVFFFDAMDQMDDVTAVYKFFALTDVNPNVHIICSGINSYSSISGDQVVVMNPLSSDQINHILNGSLGQYGKKLSRSMKQAVLKKESCANPLFLKAFISQLITYGTYASFQDFFWDLMRANTFGEIFVIAVERIKHYFRSQRLDESLVNDALGLIVYSNNGIKENEMQEILNLMPVARSVFLSAIELFTIEDNGRIRLNHDLIIKATKNILLNVNRKFELSIARKLVDYFAKQENSWRKYSELPYQLCKLKKYTDLKRTLLGADCFLYLCKNEYHSAIAYLSHLVDVQDEIAASLVSAMTKPADIIVVADMFCQAGCHNAAIITVEAMLSKATDPDTYIRLMDILARSQYKLALDHYRIAIDTYQKLLEYYRNAYPQDRVGYAARAYLLGVAYKSSGQFVLGNQIMQECIDIYEQYNICNATSIWAQDVYGEFCYYIGKLNKALSILDKTCSTSLRLFGPMSPELAWAYCYGWNTLYAVGDKANALEKAWDAYSIYNEIYLGKGTKVAWAAANAGTAAMIHGDYERARELHMFAIKENDCIIPESKRPHIYSLTSYANLANLFERTRQHDAAVGVIRFAMEQSISKNGANHIYTANIILNAGIIERDVELIRKAIEIYRNRPVVTPDIYFAQICIARVYVQLGEEEKAVAEINACLEEYSKFEYNQETDLITFLLLDSVEKITGELTPDMEDTLDELFRFNDYEFFLTHNNHSNVIIIPKI